MYVVGIVTGLSVCLVGWLCWLAWNKKLGGLIGMFKKKGEPVEAESSVVEAGVGEAKEKKAEPKLSDGQKARLDLLKQVMVDGFAAVEAHFPAASVAELAQITLLLEILKAAQG